MKKLLSLLFAMILVLSCETIFANDNISVKIDGTKIDFDVVPQIINDRTMVPLRKIFESLGADVYWDGDTKTVTSKKDNNIIKLTINDPVIYVNGTQLNLDSPACLVDGRTLVPVRAVSEAFKCGVDWDGNTRTVYIATNPELCQNGHEWKNATCTLPQICVHCGRENGEAIGHILSDYTITKEPTCSEQGVKSAICTVCESVIDENIPQLEHTPGELEIVRTKTDIGKKAKKCTDCGFICYEEEYEKTKEEKKADYKYYCAKIDYLTLSRIADVQKGHMVNIKGCIMQAIEEGDYFMFLVEMTKIPYGWDDIIMVIYNRNDVDLHRFVEDEIIEIYGEIGGLYQYETRGGTLNTVPRINAKYIDKGYVIVD